MLATPSLEWDPFHEGLEDMGGESLLGGIQRLSRPSETRPNLLEERRILVVSTEESSIESLEADDSLEEVFAAAMMTSEEMETDKTNLEDLITQAEAEIELNPVEFIQVGKPST